MDIPDDHPRAQSLRVRHAIIEGMKANIVAEAGLIAHGRGEAYDYLLGEKTHDFASKAIKAAAAQLYIAEHPILSVNGNVTVLCPEEMVDFSNSANIPLEINLFYRSEKRVQAITQMLEEHEAMDILGNDEEFYGYIEEISSARRIVDTRGIAISDVVFVPLEDGDRTIGLKKNNKIVITVDLNPLSRTSITADITIVDNVIRVFPQLQAEYFKIKSKSEAKKILRDYDNKIILRESMEAITQNFKMALAN